MAKQIEKYGRYNNELLFQLLLKFEREKNWYREKIEKFNENLTRWKAFFLYWFMDQVAKLW